jgi:hypothetical protein
MTTFLNLTEDLLYPEDDGNPMSESLSGAEKYGTQKLNTVIRENSILSANSAFFFNDADAGGGLA